MIAPVDRRATRTNRETLPAPYHQHRDDMRRRASRKAKLRATLLPLMDPDAEPITRLKAAIVARMILDAGLWRTCHQRSEKALAPLRSELATGSLDELADALDHRRVSEVLDMWEVNCSARRVVELAKNDYCTRAQFIASRGTDVGVVIDG
jgi:hypothetical protein